MTGWNLPPGVIGNERQIAGLSKQEEKICNECPYTNEYGECDPNRPDCPLLIRDMADDGPHFKRTH